MKLLSIIFTIFFCSQVFADKTKIELVQSNVTEINQSFYVNKNTKTVIKYTLPKIIEVMGGEEQASKTITQILKKMESTGMKLKFMKFPKEPTFFKTKNYEYVIVPTLTHITAQGKVAESLNSK